MYKSRHAHSQHFFQPKNSQNSETGGLCGIPHPTDHLPPTPGSLNIYYFPDVALSLSIALASAALE